jgi:hypothetical protein
MRQTLKTIAGKIFPDAFENLDINKRQLIDFACQLGMHSFADLGAVWNVDGGYTFYAMERRNVQKAVIVDTNITPAVLARQKKHPGLKIITADFGQRTTLDEVGKVDGVLFFDTLLHQVNPNWDEVLEMYARIADIFVIFNQQYTNFTKATRLLELGREEYFRNVPHRADEEPYPTYFRDLDAIHPEHKKPYRDIHNIWQWGITDTALIAKMKDLGYKMQFYKNCGQWGHLRNVENHAFIFTKDNAIRNG